MNARPGAALVLAAVTALGVALPVGGAGGPLSISWSGPTGGGGVSSDGTRTLVGAAAQAVAGTVGSGNLKLESGLLAGGPGRTRRVIPMVSHEP